MSDKKTDFLRFNAYSIKELITRKLSEDTKFTDQIYEGSNLAILIDLVSYMYQCLLYQLNNAAAESMFSDTQIYKNISRLVNLIGYHPSGVQPSTMTVYLEADEQIEGKIILPCTYFDTGLTDSKGKSIYFSTVFNKQTNAEGEEQQSDGNYTIIPFVNGLWKQYSTVFKANGVENETFVLNGLQSDSDSDQYIANDYIQVFVLHNGVFEQYNYDKNELFIQAYDSITTDNKDVAFARIYNRDDKIYSIKLNEEKVYEIKFGNGIVGHKLDKNDKIYILYLETNGEDGYIDTSSIDINGIKLEHGVKEINLQLQNWLFPINERSKNISTVENIGGYLQLSQTTKAKLEQDVNDIKENAPNWFKSGNRLITKVDYEYIVKNCDEGIIDIKCMNNWEYMTKFYRWLYNLGKNPISYSNRESNPYLYIEKERLINNGFKFVDSADANNIYLWIKYSDQNRINLNEIKSRMDAQLLNIKTMTSETYPLTPIDVYFDISFTPEELYYDLLNINSNSSFDNDYSYLEITMSDNSIYSNAIITNKVKYIISNAFKSENCKLGQSINYNDILQKIYEINGVERVRTVFYPDPENEELQEVLKKYNLQTRHCDGISFASYTNKLDLINIGDDLNISNTIRQLEDFQFPSLSPYTESQLESKIKIIKKSMNTTNPVKF